MRRALLTAAPPAPKVKVIGNDSADPTANHTAYTKYIYYQVPATSTTTITEVRIGRQASGATFRLFAVNNTSFIVGAVTGDLVVPAGSGYETLTTSLPITAGDYLGIYRVSGTGVPYRTGGEWYGVSGAVVPTAGVDYSGSLAYLSGPILCAAGYA